MLKKLFLIVSFILLMGFGFESIKANSIDEPDDWAKSFVDEGIRKNIIPAELRNNYRSNITREDFCILTISYLENFYNKDVNEILISKEISVKENPFSDTNNVAIQMAYSIGIVSGTSKTTFSPKNFITRQEASVMIKKASEFIGYNSYGENFENFVDGNLIANWSMESVYFVSSNSIMKGTGNGNFSPVSNYTRQQAYITFINFDKVLSKNVVQEKTLVVGNKSIKLKDSESSVKETFGTPMEILKSENWNWLVYYTDYRDLIFVGIKNEEVVALATNCESFSYDEKIKNGYSVTADDKVRYGEIFIMDGNIVDGVYIKLFDGQSTLEETIEKENALFTNAFRVKNKLKPFVFNSKLKSAAQKHSEDMAENNFFTHTSSDGEELSERLSDVKYNYDAAGENIVRGNIDGIDSYSSLINSTSHRKTILTSYKDFGVGSFTSKDGKKYFTQNFGTEL